MPYICLGTSLFLWYDFEYRKVCKINAYVLQTLLSKLFWLAVKEIITNQKPLDMKKLQAFRLLFATTQIITCKVFKLFDHSNITLIMSFKMLPSVSILLQDSFFSIAVLCSIHILNELNKFYVAITWCCRCYI